MPEPFLESVHLLREVGDAHCAVTYQPCNQHDRKTRAETEDERHEPVPSIGQGKRDINHRQEIDKSVRAESDSEENTQDERPEPTGVGVCVLQELTDAVVVLMVMMSAEEQYDTADEHKARKDGFAPMREYMLNTGRLCAHEERDTEEYVCGQFAENEHRPVAEHLSFVIDFLINITDGSDARNQCTRVENRQQS